MIKHILTLLFVVELLCCVKLNSAVATEDIKGKQETVIQHRIIEQPQPKRTYTEQELAEINAAKEVVKKYWVSSYDTIYDLLSMKYKERLKKTRNISNAADYKKSKPASERVWLSQTYQSSTMQNDSFIQIAVLAAWEEEGYQGVMTFIFDMMKEDGRWTITNIMF
jgi:hypothetical protein